jgi:hypothetical protein
MGGLVRWLCHSASQQCLRLRSADLWPGNVTSSVCCRSAVIKMQSVWHAAVIITATCFSCMCSCYQQDSCIRYVHRTLCSVSRCRCSCWCLCCIVCHIMSENLLLYGSLRGLDNRKEKTAHSRVSWSVLPGKYSGDDVEKKEIGEVCTACVREEKYTEGGSEETGRNKNNWTI